MRSDYMNVCEAKREIAEQTFYRPAVQMNDGYIFSDQMSYNFPHGIHTT